MLLHILPVPCALGLALLLVLAPLSEADAAVRCKPPKVAHKGACHYPDAVAHEKWRAVKKKRERTWRGRYKKRLEKTRKRCAAGKTAACDALGELMKGPLVARDDARWAKRYRKVCAAGDQFGCLGLAIAYLYNRGLTWERCSSGRCQPRYEKKALALLTRACDAKNGPACAAASHMISRGLGGAKSKGRSDTLTKRACDLGSLRGCTNYGSALWQRGEKAEGMRYAEKACDAGSPQGCNLLGKMLTVENRRRADLVQALKLFQQACKRHSNEGCYNLAHMYFNGLGVDRDPKKGVKYVRLACTALHGHACYVLGMKYEKGELVKRSLRRAVAYYRTGCSKAMARRHWDACFNIAKHHFYGTAGLAKDTREAFALWREGCEHKHRLSCNAAGVHAHQNLRDARLALTFFEKACALGAKGACANAALTYLKGAPGVPANPILARELYLKACKAGDQASCRRARNLGAQDEPMK